MSETGPTKKIYTPLDYERLDADLLSQAIMTAAGEFVVCRNAFRWKRDGKVISNGYEMFELEGICEDRDWEVVCRYGDHIAVCKEKSA